ncbi:MAG TPA: DUF4168 domain-containing protein [Crinalium sp.]|jgi:hypothetical protein
MLKQLLTGGSALVLGVAGSFFTPVWAQSMTSPTQRPAPSAGHMSAPPAGTPAQTPGTSQAQVSQTDLQKFAQALQQIHTLQQEARSQALQVLQQQGLTEEQFTAIAQSRQPNSTAPNSTAPNSTAPNTAPNHAPTQGGSMSQAAHFTPEQLQHFDQASAQLNQMHQANRTRMQQALANQGLTVEQFNAILSAVRRDPQTEQRLLALLHHQ